MASSPSSSETNLSSYHQKLWVAAYKKSGLPIGNQIYDISRYKPGDEAVWLRAEGDLETIQLARSSPHLLGIARKLELQKKGKI